MILPNLVLPLVSVLVPPTDPPPATHPHYPMQTRIAGAQGQVAIGWFTLPYAEAPRRDIKPTEAKEGYLWSRGFCWKSEMDVQAGEVRIPKGEYLLGFKRSAKAWQVILQDREARRLSSQLRRARRGATADPERVKALEAQLAAARKKNLVLPTRAIAGEHAEHMDLVVLNRGFRTRSRRDATPAGGMKAELRFSFGDFHIAVPLEEVVAQPQDDKAARRSGR